MKKIIFALLLLTSSLHSQEFKNIHFDLGSFTTSNKSVGFEGLNLKVNFGTTLSIDKNLIKLEFYKGGELQLFGGKSENLFGINAMYGRDFLTSDYLSLEIYGGIGFFQEEIDIDTTTNDIFITNETIALPLKVEFSFKTFGIFHSGIYLEGNINKYNSLFGGGLAIKIDL